MSNTEEINDLNRRYVEAHHKGDGKAVASLFAEDAVLIAPERQPVGGRAEIRKFYKGLSSSSIEIDVDNIEIKGELTWQTGLVHRDEDGQRRYAVFVDVLRRQNGEWRYVATSWNSSDGFDMA